MEAKINSIRVLEECDMKYFKRFMPMYAADVGTGGSSPTGAEC